jgi:hypothetical protein
VTIYSTQLCAGTSTVTSTVYYTVPVGTTVIVRDIEVFNGTAGSDSLNVDRGVSGVNQQIIYRAVNLSAAGWAQWKGRAVLNAGEQLMIASGVAGWTFLVSGYVLS